MKKKSFGFSSIIYTEWLIPIFDYYASIRRNDAIFEIVIPAIISVFCSNMYRTRGLVIAALDHLAELLPTAISILIGFTGMLITLLLTSSGEGIDKIKNTETEKKLHKERITLYQGLHIQFSHTLFSEIELLLIVFFYLFLSGFCCPSWLSVAFLFLEVYLTLNVLLSILRGIANLYFSFYKGSK